MVAHPVVRCDFPFRWRASWVRPAGFQMATVILDSSRTGTAAPGRFDDPALALPEVLRRALAARGYDTPMPVQAAILAPAARGRDLLVSSPTGSGKTIAFGAALAETLLDAAAAGSPAAAAAGPAR